MTSEKEYIEPCKIQDQALSLWSGSTDSKTLDYRRTNPKEYQIVRTHTKETTWIQDPASPSHQLPLCRTPHLKNKMKIQTQGLPPHSALSIRGKTNIWTKTQHKSHPIQSSHKPLDQPEESRNQKEERIQLSSRKEFNFPSSLGKEDLKHNN